MKSLRNSLLLVTFFAAYGVANAQVTLSGTSYTQNFNSVGSVLPTGWSVNTATTVSTLGTTGSFTSTATNWNSGTAGTDFRNISSDDIAFGSGAAAQGGNSNRAIGWRPLAAGSNARDGSVMLTLTNTTGFTNFSLSMDVFTANDVNLSQVYSLEYRVGDTGNFTQISTYTTPSSGATTFNTQTLTATSITLSALNDQSSAVFIRLRGTTTTGTSLDTVGIDDFSLSYSAAAIPEPSTYAAIFGAIALLGVVVHKRRQRRAV